MKTHLLYAFITLSCFAACNKNQGDHEHPTHEAGVPVDTGPDVTNYNRDDMGFALDCGCNFDLDMGPEGALDMAPDQGTATIRRTTDCSTCRGDEICVQKFDGTCTTAGAFCVPNPLNCKSNECNEECEDTLCGWPYTCADYAPSCGSELEGALNCYGS